MENNICFIVTYKTYEGIKDIFVFQGEDAENRAKQFIFEDAAKLSKELSAQGYTPKMMGNITDDHVQVFTVEHGEDVMYHDYYLDAGRLIGSDTAHKGIKRCPVCGTEQYVYPAPSQDGKVRCYCNCCDLNLPGPGFDSDEDAIKQWNEFVTTKHSVQRVGDIMTTQADVLAHQVNTLGIMGKGLALQIRGKYPNVFEAYEKQCKEFSAKELLGTVLFWPTDARTGPKVISNCFGQNKTDYDALRAALQMTAEEMRTTGMRSIAIPLGIGGDWNVVKGIITDVFAHTDIFVELWRTPKSK